MPVRIFAGDTIFTIDPSSPAIIAGIDCFVVTKADRKFTANTQSQMPCPRCLAQDAPVASTTFPVSTMPTWFTTMFIRPKLSRFARKSLALKSPEGVELASSLRLNFGKGLMDTPVATDSTIRQHLIGPAAVLKRDAVTDRNGVNFGREPPSSCAGCPI
jgi:hypothetical protein